MNRRDGYPVLNKTLRINPSIESELDTFTMKIQISMVEKTKKLYNRWESNFRDGYSKKQQKTTTTITTKRDDSSTTDFLYLNFGKTIFLYFALAALRAMCHISLGKSGEKRA